MEKVIYGKGIEVHDVAIERTKKFNISINEEYYDFLYDYRNPTCFFMKDEKEMFDKFFSDYVIVDCDNKYLYDLFGQIAFVGKKGMICDSIVDAVINNNDYYAKFLFMNIIEGCIQEYNLFGEKIEAFNNIYLRKLNKYVKEIYNWEKYNSRKYYDELIEKGKIASRYEDYVLQAKKNKAFLIGNKIINADNVYPKDRSNLSKEEYQKSLKSLLERYTVNGECGFSEVEKLKKHDYSGIYVLCLEKEMGFYIGQSYEINKRIKSHFTKLNSYFDLHHLPSDITKIYCLYCNTRYLDTVEKDCIAYLPQKYVLNILGGGKGTIQLTYSDRYNSKKNLMRSQQLINRVKDSIIFHKNNHI